MERKSIVRLASLLLLAALLVCAAGAQTPMAKQKASNTDRVAHLKSLLQLNDAQTSQVSDILARADAQAAAHPMANKKAAKKVLRAREASVDKDIEALLTPDQQKKYDTYKKARRDQSKGWRKGKGSEYNF